MINIPSSIIRVRYSDVDRMGLLYHVNYFEYFEVARSDWIRHFWKPYKEIEDSGLALVVIEAHLNYLKSGRYDDEIEIRTGITEYGRSRLKFEYDMHLRGQDARLCTGWTTHCFVNSLWKPVAIPTELRERLNQYLGTLNQTKA